MSKETSKFSWKLIFIYLCTWVAKQQDEKMVVQGNHIFGDFERHTDDKEVTYEFQAGNPCN